ncbi:MAG TPA: serine hydrolase [Saprospiraceae bacterium]|nr:serine hydrolase [Saprospiraceae bacterium]HMQ84929.1 serine hydrolase [Saprospiraceae bacterium]
MKKIIVLLFATATVASCFSQSKKPIIEGDEGARLDSLLTPYLLQLRDLTNNQAGLAVGVTKGEKIMYARTFGYANIKDSTEADFNTVFHIASVSKPFTAAAVVKLVEQGKLNLDDFIVKHIPEFEMKDARFKQITIKQILTHTSGIPSNISASDWEKPVYGDKALEKNLADIKPLMLDFEPGTEFNYSNSAFDILGIIVSRSSSLPFAEYVKTYILTPSGMTNSFYSKPQGTLPANWAVPYSYGIETQIWSPFPYSENYFPSSGLHTTLLDMCNWGMLYANNGRHKDNVVIKPDYFSLLSAPNLDTPWGDKIGLSWFVQAYLDRPIIMHQGNDTGFESIMYVYPKDSISVIIMANRDFSRTGRIINAVSEFLFEQKAKDYSVSAKYPFTMAYNEHGIAYASELWEQLKKDSTDIYQVNDEDILTTGAVLENGKNWAAAREILEYYITLDNNSTYAWRLLGNAYLNLGNKAQAKSCYEKTLLINPDYEKGKKALEDLEKMKN